MTITSVGVMVAFLVYRRDRAERISETARRVHISYLEDLTLDIRNDGPTPIRDLQVAIHELVLDYKPGREVGWKLLPHVQPGEHTIVPPDHDHGVHLPRTTAYALKYSFTDADGLRWRRGWRGHLVRIR